jgi:phospholipid/cholesterol/gamma-HCH transport system ATP-binding protein
MDSTMTEEEIDHSSTEDREPIIRCENVVLGYRGEAVLTDIDIEIYRGQITALLGGSGSGKSTLLKTMVGLLPPMEGNVYLMGEDVYALDDERRRQLLQRTGMVFQYGALFGSRTILDNIALPLRQHTSLPEPVIHEMVRIKLALVGLEGLEDRLPADVSGGQRKRVSLARAAILDPEIIFCDEPSAGLDPVVAAGLDKVLRDFQRMLGMTMIIITHELESIKILADRVIMLADGTIRAIGTIEELSESTDELVHDFFHRVPPDYVSEEGGESVMERIESGRQRS